MGGVAHHAGPHHRTRCGPAWRRSIRDAPAPETPGHRHIRHGTPHSHADERFVVQPASINMTWFLPPHRVPLSAFVLVCVALAGLLPRARAPGTRTHMPPSSAVAAA